MSSTSALSSLLSSASSSSAIDISSLLEAAMGASTPGIDVTSAVSAAVTAAEAPEDTWQSQITTLQGETSDLTQIQSVTTALDTDMQSLASLTGPLAATTVASSDSSVVTASAASGSTAGTVEVEVNSLASTASYASSTLASATTALSSGTITLTNSSGTQTTFNTGSGTSGDTLSDLESAINSAGVGVTANIITDSSGSMLELESTTSGSAGNFTVSSSGSAPSFTQGDTGSNASLTVNGITITSASNTVTGAVPGLTLNLMSASAGTQVTLTTAPNTSSASTAINQFVTDYNTLIGDLNTEYADSGSGQGDLADDPTVRNLQSDLLNAVGYTASPASGNSTTTVPNLASLGITVNDDGTLSVDSTTLNSTLANNFSDVQNFFQGSASNGFANTLDQQLTSFTSPSDGAFTVDLQSISTQTTALQTDITNFQTNVITPLQTQLQSQYSQAEILLQQLPTEIKQIDTELGQNSSSS